MRGRTAPAAGCRCTQSDERPGRTLSDRPGRRLGGREGYSLGELLVALLVAGVFLAGLASLLQALSEGAREVIRRVDQVQLVRTVWVVLEEELAAGRFGADWRLDGEHAIELRAFRALGRVVEPADLAEPTDGADRWVVEWVGHRDPVAGRDSLMVLTADGTWYTTDLRWVGSGPDSTGNGAGATEGGGVLAGARGARWEWTHPTGPPPILVRVFESGRYSLEDGAFRYRRGAGGRQPLTPELLGGGSGFQPSDDGLRVRLEFRSGDPAEWHLPASLP